MHRRAVAFPQIPVCIDAVLIDRDNPTRCQLAVSAWQVREIVLGTHDATIVWTTGIIAIRWSCRPRGFPLVSQFDDCYIELGQIPKTTVEIDGKTLDGVFARLRIAQNGIGRFLAAE